MSVYPSACVGTIREPWDSPQKHGGPSFTVTAAALSHGCWPAIAAAHFTATISSPYGNDPIWPTTLRMVRRFVRNITRHGNLSAASWPGNGGDGAATPPTARSRRGLSARGNSTVKPPDLAREP